MTAIDHAILNLRTLDAQPSTYEALRQAVAALGGLDKAGVVAVARGLGITTGLASKRAASQRILARLQDRAGKRAESQAIAALLRQRS